MASVTRAKYKRVTDCLMPCLRAHNISNAHWTRVTHLGWRRWSVRGPGWPARATWWGSSSRSRVSTTSSMSSCIWVTFSVSLHSLLTWALSLSQSHSPVVSGSEIGRWWESERFYQYWMLIKSSSFILMKDVTFSVTLVTGVMSVTELSRILVTRGRGILAGCNLSRVLIV